METYQVPNLWVIRSSQNCNCLGCVEATSETEAIKRFAEEMHPVVLDVYAERKFK